MTNKQKIIALQKKLEKLEAQRDAEVTRTRSGVAAGLTLTALGKLSVFSTRDQKVIGKYLSDYVDQSIERFVDDKAAAKEKAAKTGLKVETTVEGNHPGQRILFNLRSNGERETRPAALHDTVYPAGEPDPGGRRRDAAAYRGTESG